MNRIQRSRFGPALVALAALLAAVAVTPNATAAGPGVHGRVIAADLKPIAGAAIEFKDPAGRVAATATTDAAGYYKTDLRAGTYAYTVRAAGYRDENVGRGLTLRLSEGYAVYDFTLTPGANDANPPPPPGANATAGRLRGQVYEKGADGEVIGVNGATITLRRGETGATAQVHNRPPGDAAKADSGYELTLEAGAWKAAVEAEGFEPLVDAEPIDVSDDKLAIRDFLLKRIAKPKDQGIRGTVLVDGKPPAAELLPSIRVAARCLDNPAVDQDVPLGADGTYRVPLPAGRYELTANAEGYQPARNGPVVVVEGAYSVADLTLRLRPTELLVHVVDAEDQRPLVGASVLVRAAEGPDKSPKRYRADGRGTALHRAAGPGSYQALATHAGYEPADGQSLTLSAGRRGEVTIALRKSAAPPSPTPAPPPIVVVPPVPVPVPVLTTLVVKVTDGHRPVHDAHVSVGLGAGRLTGSTGADGLCALRLPGPGAYPVVVRHRDYAPNQGTVVAALGDNLQLVVLSRPKKSTLHVLVREAGQQKVVPVAGAQVQVRHQGKTVAQGASDALGRFRADLDVGLYEVVAAKGGFQQERPVTADLTRGDTQAEVALARLNAPQPKGPTGPTMPPHQPNTGQPKTGQPKTGQPKTGTPMPPHNPGQPKTGTPPKPGGQPNQAPPPQPPKSSPLPGRGGSVPPGKPAHTPG